MAIPVLKTPAEAAALLGVSPGTLSVWRSTKRYPLTYVKVGSKVFYLEKDIEAFLENRTVVTPAKGIAP